MPDLQEDPASKLAALEKWWLKTAEAEIAAVVPKAIAYGASDLFEIGRQLAICTGRQVSDEEAAEMGCYYYALGKMARWTDAVRRGDRVSDDTVHDMGVYARMVQRIRVAGGWPG